MKVVIDIGEEDINKIKKALSTENYSSITEFISLAIQNQLTLEKEIPNLESLVKSKSERNQKLIIDNKKEFEIDDSTKVKTVGFNGGQDSFPFWGTQNKYLCLKQITKDFAKLALMEDSNWIRFDVTLNYLIQQAIETRKKFETIDKHLHRPRGDRFSTGLPLNDSKSVTRYEKQFIGGIDSNDNYYGMAVAMGFLAARRNESTNRTEFGLTKDGLDFSNLNSTIFNKKISDIEPSTPQLSKEEVEYILSILKKHKNSEINLMKTTIKYISEGKNRPDNGQVPTKEYLDKTYPELAKSKRDGSFSKLEAETIRSGVVSRLNELGLINIMRKGIKSEYQITEEGFNFIKISGG